MTIINMTLIKMVMTLINEKITLKKDPYKMTLMTLINEKMTL